MNVESDMERRELGWKGSLFVGCGIGLVVFLVVGFAVYWRGKAAEKLRVEKTRAALEANRTCLKLVYREDPLPRVDGSGEDWTGMRALTRGTEKFEWELLDGWGNPIHYRCPGPVHKKGWDLWSCGPNGKDDQGTFDDILVGEDVAPVRS